MSRAYLILLFLFMVTAGCLAEDNAIVKSTAGEEAVQEATKAEDPYTWDFGQVKQGELQKHNFILKNESQKTLNIKSVNTSCGCTVSEVQKNTLQPGEETSIGVTFNSKGYSGAVQQFVYVNTDDPDNPIIKFTIKAEVVKSVDSL